jgi:hypothetical protein
MKQALLFFLVVLCNSSFCQDLRTDSVRQGTIRLKSGKTINGDVEYNIYTNALMIRESVNKRKTFSVWDVDSFEFYDTNTGSVRTFVSLYFELPDTGEKEPQFFEILKGYDDFTVALRTYPVKIERKTHLSGWAGYARENGAASASPIDKLVTEQVEVLCFITGDNTIRPFVEYKTKQKDQLTGGGLDLGSDRLKTRVINKRLPKELLGDEFQAAADFANTKKLSWSKRDELISILDSVSKR